MIFYQSNKRRWKLGSKIEIVTYSWADDGEDDSGNFTCQKNLWIQKEIGFTWIFHINSTQELVSRHTELFYDFCAILNEEILINISMCSVPDDITISVSGFVQTYILYKIRRSNHFFLGERKLHQSPQYLYWNIKLISSVTVFVVKYDDSINHLGHPLTRVMLCDWRGVHFTLEFSDWRQNLLISITLPTMNKYSTYIKLYLVTSSACQ